MGSNVPEGDCLIKGGVGNSGGGFNPDHHDPGAPIIYSASHIPPGKIMSSREAKAMPYVQLMKLSDDQQDIWEKYKLPPISGASGTCLLDAWDDCAKRIKPSNSLSFVKCLYMNCLKSMLGDAYCSNGCSEGIADTDCQRIVACCCVEVAGAQDGAPDEDGLSDAINCIESARPMTEQWRSNNWGDTERFECLMQMLESAIGCVGDRE
jgi:hypothetical protein